MNETEKAYLAGIIDGEGCIYLHWEIVPTTKHISVYPEISFSLHSSEKSLIDWIAKNYKSNRRSRKDRNGITLHLSGKKRVKKVLLDVFPYLRLKRKQANLILEAIDLMSIKVMNYRPRWVYLKLAEISEKISQLNVGGGKTNRKWTYGRLVETINKTVRTEEEIKEFFKKFSKAGIEARKGKYLIPKEKLEKVKEYFMKGMSQRKIVEKVGIGRNTVSKIIRDLKEGVDIFSKTVG
jgi:hypothetical protein